MEGFVAEYPEEYHVVMAAGIIMGCTIAAESIKQSLEGHVSIIPIEFINESIRRN